MQRAGGGAISKKLFADKCAQRSITRHTLKHCPLLKRQAQRERGGRLVLSFVRPLEVVSDTGTAHG